MHITCSYNIITKNWVLLFTVLSNCLHNIIIKRSYLCVLLNYIKYSCNYARVVSIRNTHIVTYACSPIWDFNYFVNENRKIQSLSKIIVYRQFFLDFDSHYYRRAQITDQSDKGQSVPMSFWSVLIPILWIHVFEPIIIYNSLIIKCTNNGPQFYVCMIIYYYNLFFNNCEK